MDILSTLKVFYCLFYFLTPLDLVSTFLYLSKLRNPEIPNIPSKRGIITLISACGIVMPKPAQIGETIKLIPREIAQLQPTRGLQDD